MSIKYNFKDEIHKAYDLPPDLSSLIASLPSIFIHKLPKDFTIQYTDNDGDRVTISTDCEYQALVKHEITTPFSCLKLFIAPLEEILNKDQQASPKIAKSPSGNGSFEVVEDAENQSNADIIEFSSTKSPKQSPNESPDESLNQSSDEYINEKFDSFHKEEKEESESKIVVSLAIPPPSTSVAKPPVTNTSEQNTSKRLENTAVLAYEVPVPEDISLSMDSDIGKEIPNEIDDADNDNKIDAKSPEKSPSKDELSFTSGSKGYSEAPANDDDASQKEKSLQDDESQGNEESEELSEVQPSETFEKEDQSIELNEILEGGKTEMNVPDLERSPSQGQEKWVSFSSNREETPNKFVSYSYGCFEPEKKEIEAPKWMPVRSEPQELFLPPLEEDRVECKEIMERRWDNWAKKVEVEEENNVSIERKWERWANKVEAEEKDSEDGLAKELDELERMFEGLRGDRIQERKEILKEILRRDRMNFAAKSHDERFEIGLGDASYASKEKEFKWDEESNSHVDHLDHMDVEHEVSCDKKPEEDLREVEISLLEITEAKKIATAIGSFMEPTTMKRRWVRSPERKRVGSPIYNRWVSRNSGENSTDKSSREEESSAEVEMREMNGYSKVDNGKKQEEEDSWPFLRQSKLWRRRETWNFGLKSEEPSMEEPEKEVVERPVNSFCMRCWVSPIRGPKYVCLVCNEIEYCESCEKWVSHIHPLLKVKEKIDSGCLMEDLREKLMRSHDKEEEEHEEDEISYKELEDAEEEAASRELEHPLSLWGKRSMNSSSQGHYSYHSSLHMPLTCHINDHVREQHDEAEGHEVENDYRFECKEISSTPLTIRSSKKEWCLVYKTICLRNIGKSNWRKCSLEPVGSVPGTTAEVAYVVSGDSVLVTLEIHGFFEPRRHASTWKLSHVNEEGMSITMGYIVLEFEILEERKVNYEQDDMFGYEDCREGKEERFEEFREEELEWFN